MEAVIDQAGRVVLPKPIRDALGLLPGTKVDITPYGAGAQLLPAGRTARLVEEDGVLVADAETPVDDDMVFALIDAGRLLNARFATPFMLSRPLARKLPDTLSRLGIAGGAVYDALVALAAKEHGAALATRDARARGTYDAVGVTVIAVT